MCHRAASRWYSLRMRHFILRFVASITLVAVTTGCASHIAPSLGAWQDGPRPDSADAIGSTRNSVVAFPMPAGERVPLTFLTGDVSAEELAEWKKAAPNVTVIAGLDRQ